MVYSCSFLRLDDEEEREDDEIDEVLLELRLLDTMDPALAGIRRVGAAEPCRRELVLRVFEPATVCLVLILNKSASASCK